MHLGNLRIDGAKKKARVLTSAFAVLFCLVMNAFFWYLHCDSRSFLLLFSVLALSLSIIVFLRGVDRIDFNSFTFFAVSLGVSGFLFMVLFTPGSIPDEQYHFYRSYVYADLLLGESVDSSSGDFAMRECDAGLLVSPVLSNDQFQYVWKSFFLGGYDTSLTSFSVGGSISYSSNPFYVKLPSALFIAFARVLELGPLPLFYLGRLGNFLLFYFLALASVRLVPVFSKGLKLICLLPMTLHLTSSYSYDAGVIGLAMLLSALVMRMFCSECRCSWKLLFAVVAVTALLVPCKVIYSFIAVLTLFVPANRFSNKWQCWLFKIAVPLVVMLVVALTNLASIVSMSGVDTDEGALDVRGTETGTFYSINDTLENPFGTALMFVRTLDGFGDFYISGVVGGTLCWFQANIVAPSYIVFLYVVILLLGFVPDDRDMGILKLSNRIAFISTAVAIWLCAMYSMYLGHTFNTEQYVLGVQGRYLLPALFVLMAGASPANLSLREPGRERVVFWMLALNCFYLARIFSIALAS